MRVFFRKDTKSDEEKDRRLQEMSDKIDDLRAMVAVLTSNFNEIGSEVQPVDAKEI